MIFVMQIPMNFGDLLRVIAVSPILVPAGGALGDFFIGFVLYPRIAGTGVPLLVFPRRSSPERSFLSPTPAGSSAYSPRGCR